MSRESGEKCPPGHRHNKSTYCYKIHRCRCWPCRHNAAVVRNTAKQKREQNLLSRYVAADASKERVTELSRAGYSMATLSKMTGLSVIWLVRLKSEPGKNIVLRSYEEKLFSSNIDPLLVSDGRHHVPAIGSKRKIEDLMLKGWWHGEIDKLSGLGRGASREIVTGARATVSVSTHKAISECYRKLFGREPDLSGLTARERTASVKCKERAMTYGLKSIFHWDDVEQYSQATPSKSAPSLRTKKRIKQFGPTHSCPPEHDHCASGRSTCYNEHRCRCEVCKRANNARLREYRRRRLDGAYMDQRQDVLSVA